MKSDTEWTAEDLAVAMETVHQEEYGNGWNYWAYEVDEGESEDIPGFGKVEVVEVDSGREGHGEDIFMVFRVGERYFRIQGAYYSYDGNNWDGPLREVKRKKKKVFVYE